MLWTRVQSISWRGLAGREVVWDGSGLVLSGPPHVRHPRWATGRADPLAGDHVAAALTAIAKYLETVLTLRGPAAG